MRPAKLFLALLLLAVSSACHNRIHWGNSYGAAAPVREVLVIASDAATGWSQPIKNANWQSEGARIIQTERYTLEFQMAPKDDTETESIFRELTGALHKDLFGAGYDQAGEPETTFDPGASLFIAQYSAPFAQLAELQPLTCELTVQLRHVTGNDYELTIAYREVSG